MSREVISREELLDSYARPYRRWLPVALRGYGVHYLVALTALAGIGAGVCALADAGVADTFATVALLGVAAVVFVAVWALVVGVARIRDRTWQWRANVNDDLARVRERRPHRADEDPAVAHVEYAVSVEEDGQLVTWEFEPLHAGDEWDEETVLIPGIPRYEARAVGSAPYDPTDAARAGEQLVEAQERAAGLETEAIASARLELEHGTAARELMAESRSTGDALRGVTGQRRRR